VLSCNGLAQSTDDQPGSSYSAGKIHCGKTTAAGSPGLAQSSPHDDTQHGDRQLLGSCAPLLCPRTVEMMGRSPRRAAQPRSTAAYSCFRASVPLRIVPSRWMA
jgi:hypothetical protein